MIKEIKIEEKMNHIDGVSKATYTSIAMMNHKGGVGKTTITDAMLHYLLIRNKRVLVIDGDPQHNLSQNLQIPEKGLKSLKIDDLFLNISKDDYDDSLVSYVVRVNIPTIKSGELGIIAGSPNIENAITYAKNSMTDNELHKRMENILNILGQYYDYILFDTAPSINSNINTLIMMLTDHIVVPFDGSESVLGLKQFVNAIDKTNYKDGKKPNGYFILMKYQRDTNKMQRAYRCSDKIRSICSKEGENVVFRIMKTHLDDFVCNTGIPERQIVKNYNFDGLKNDYDVKQKYENVFKDLFKRMNISKNMFDFWNENNIYNNIVEDLKTMDLVRHNGKHNTFEKVSFC